MYTNEAMFLFSGNRGTEELLLLKSLELLDALGAVPAGAFSAIKYSFSEQLFLLLQIERSDA